MSEPEGAGLKFRPEEWEALAQKWERLSDEDRANFIARMTRAQRKRHERRVATVHDGARNYANQMTTRADVIQILALYIEQNLVPMARRLDELEARENYRTKPWHRKFRVRLVVWWERFEEWLDARGIRLLTMEKHDAEDQDHDGDGARGVEGHGAGGSAHEDEGEAAPDWLHGRGPSDRNEAARATARARARAEAGRADARAGGREEGRTQEEGRQEEGQAQGVIKVVSR